MHKKAIGRLKAAKDNISTDATFLLAKLKRRMKELESEREELSGRLDRDSVDLRITEREEGSLRKRLAVLSTKEKDLSERQKAVSVSLKKVSSEIDNLRKAYSELSEVWE